MTIASTATIASPVQGKFGFYPCDKDTYLKLKRLNKILFKHKRVDATHRRWEAKAPQNRVSRPKVRNENGQITGYGEPTPLPEPKKGCEALNARISTQSKWVTIPIADHIIKDFNNARYPEKMPELVTPLLLAPEVLDDLLAKANAWYEA